MSARHEAGAAGSRAGTARRRPPRVTRGEGALTRNSWPCHLRRTLYRVFQKNARGPSSSSTSMGAPDAPVEVPAAGVGGQQTIAHAAQPLEDLPADRALDGEQVIVQAGDERVLLLGVPAEARPLASLASTSALSVGGETGAEAELLAHGSAVLAASRSEVLVGGRAASCRVEASCGRRWRPSSLPVGRGELHGRRPSPAAYRLQIVADRLRSPVGRRRGRSAAAPASFCSTATIRCGAPMIWMFPVVSCRRGPRSREEPVAVDEEIVQGRAGLRACAQPQGVRGHEGGVEVDVEDEAALGEALDPPGARAHVDVGGLFEVVRRRREEDIVRGDADIGDGPAAVGLAQVLEDLDARDQIPGAVERLGGRADAAERLDVGADLADGVGGDVDAEGLHPAVAKGFDQEALRAPDVEHPARLDLGDDAIGDGREEVDPLDLCCGRRGPGPRAVS